MARRALALLERFQSGREAYAEGARAERRRIARDLHDDVGARLLTGMHEAPPQARPLLREALADIRTIVGGLTGEQRTLDRVLGDLRHETVRRLEAAGIALDWPVDDAGDARLLDYDIYKNLSSVFRELVSNLIRHAGAGTAHVRVNSEPDLLVIEIADDGVGLREPSREVGGNGLRNAAERLTALGGEIAFPIAEKGTSIRITLPLPIPLVTPEQGVQSSPATP
jgi:signal transduction histidine kinase